MVNRYTGYGSRTKVTPQSEAIPGREAEMATNNAGGVGFVLDDWTRFTRFLILGSADNYYVGERKLTKQNIDCMERLIKAGRGLDMVDHIVQISQSKRAASNDPALFALARLFACDQYGMVAYTRPAKEYTLHREHHTALFEKWDRRGTIEEENGSDVLRREGETIVRNVSAHATTILHPHDVAVRIAARHALLKVARIPTHLFHFSEYVKQFRGRGTALNRAISSFYTQEDTARLAYLVVKYQQRDGRSHRDELRLTHPKAPTAAHGDIYRWATKGWKEGVELTILPEKDALSHIWAYEKAKHESDPNAIVDLITTYHLTREMLPTEALRNKEVWKALLLEMPMEAMLRNLATMTANGTLEWGGVNTAIVCGRLRDAKRVQESGLHPMKILAALLTYSAGRSARGSSTWTPIPAVKDALDAAFYLAFGNVPTTGKRIQLALDVSGSMSGPDLNGIPGLTPRVATAALALVTAAREPHHVITGFTAESQSINGWRHNPAVSLLDISPGQRLDDVLRYISGLSMGGTDCALPMTWAMTQKKKFDAFVILTDNESWAGPIQPAQALVQYRKQFVQDAKLVVVGMTATEFSVADLKDSGSLNVVGFDTATPTIISEFIAGNV